MLKGVEANMLVTTLMGGLGRLVEGHLRQGFSVVMRKVSILWMQ